MLGWVAQILLFTSGIMVGWFLPESADNFEIFRMMGSIFLIILMIVLIIYHRRLIALMQGKEPPEDD